MIVILTLVTSILGACTTYVLSEKFQLSKVLASALPSLLVALIFKVSWLSGLQFSSIVPVAFIGSTFCGMTTSRVIGSTWRVCLSALLYGILFSSSTLFFKGYGGGLGTIACVSVIATTGAARLWDKLQGR